MKISHRFANYVIFKSCASLFVHIVVNRFTKIKQHETMPVFERVLNFISIKFYLCLNIWCLWSKFNILYDTNFSWNFFVRISLLGISIVCYCLCWFKWSDLHDLGSSDKWSSVHITMVYDHFKISICFKDWIIFA